MKGVIPWQNDPAWPHSMPEVEIDLDRTALVVVDVQNPDHYGQIVPNIARLLEFFRGNSLENIYLRVGYFLKDRRDMHAKRAVTWSRKPDGSAPDKQRGAPAFEIIDRLAPESGETIIDKNSTSAFNSSNLEGYLRAREVQNLVICGVATNHCVDNTARGAADRGYNVILVDDACRDADPSLHEATMRSFRRDFGAVKSTDEVVADLGGVIDAAGAGTGA